MLNTPTTEVRKLKRELKSCEQRLKDALEQYEQNLLPLSQSVNKHIFISYSKKDSEFTHKLSSDLEAAGFRIWIDKRSIQIGDDWRNTIEKNLREAGEVIVVVSPNALESEWVPYEGALAIGWEKPIYPILIAEVPSLPPWLDKYQYIDFLNDSYETCLAGLIKKLTPQNPVQDLLEMQVFIHKKTGELIGEALMQVIEDSLPLLKISPEAKELIELSQSKISQNREHIRALQEEAIAAKQLSTLGTAIAALQHRINNTFNIIVPNITRLRSRVDLNDPTIVEILDIIERNARYTSMIIARVQEPLKEVEVTNININVIIEDLVIRFSHIESYGKISITTTLDETIPYIRGSSGQLAEVFDSIMVNAFQAMPTGGDLQIISRVEGPFISVYFRDTGNGIPQSVQERLFKKPVPSKQTGGGTGLGLWLSRLMLQSIGGNIKIEKSDATGTSMLVQLPLARSRVEVEI